MPLDGSGVAAKPAGTTAVSNTTIQSSAFNSVINDIYAIFNSARPVAYGGTGATSALTFTDLTSSTSVITPFLKDQGGTVTTGGSANAQTVTLNQAIATTVPTGFFFTVKFGYTNTSTTVTLNVNSIGAKSVKVFRGTALGDPAVGDVQKDNYGHVLYDGTQFVLLNPSLLSAANTWSAQQSFTNSALDVQVGQIKFPATQNASSNANTLDDYEEGSVSLTISQGSTLTHTDDRSTYSKIGRLVHVELWSKITSAGTTATPVSISGLPFSPSVSPTGGEAPVGQYHYLDSGNAYYCGTACWDGSTVVGIASGAGTPIGQGGTGGGFAAANNDRVGFSINYETT